MFYFYKVHKFRLLLANLHYTSSDTNERNAVKFVVGCVWKLLSDNFDF